MRPLYLHFCTYVLLLSIFQCCLFPFSTEKGKECTVIDFFYVCYCINAMARYFHCVCKCYIFSTLLIIFFHVCFPFHCFTTCSCFVIFLFDSTIVEHLIGYHTKCINILQSIFYVFEKYCHRALRLSTDCCLFHWPFIFVRLTFDNG